MSHQKTNRRLLLVALLLVSCLGLIFNYVNPLFEPPDEYQHYQYIRHLITDQELPIQAPDGEISQSHQPPLYYWVSVWLVSGVNDPGLEPTRNPFWAYDEPGVVSQTNKLQFLNEATNQFPYTGGALVIHLARLGSLIFILIGVIAVWAIGQNLWPTQPYKIALLLALSGLNPMLLYLAGAINNDSLLFMWGTVMLLLCLHALEKSFPWHLTVLIGLVSGLALITKLNGLMLLVPWSVALLWQSWQKHSWGLLLSRGFIILSLSALVAGWWFIRNDKIYGDPLALEIVLTVWGERTAENQTFSLLWADAKYSWTNLWGRFGYGQVPLPEPLYGVFGIICLISLAAGLIYLGRNIRRIIKVEANAAVWIVFLSTFSVYVAALSYYIWRNPTGANGRYTFPALAALAALLTAGLFKVAPLQKRPSLSIPITATLVGIAVYSAAVYLPWVYAPPPLLTVEQASQQIDQPADIVWNNEIRLLGTAVSPTEVTANQPIHITACWEALAPIDTNYTLFVTVLDYQSRPLGQEDTYPGLGTRPTSAWQPGTRFCDRYTLQVDDNIALPTVATVDIGFYDLASGERLAPTANSSPINPPLHLQQLKIVPISLQAIAKPETFVAGFEQGITLIAYDWSEVKTAVNQTVTVQVTWYSSGPLGENYTIFAHLLDANGNLLVQDDGPPRDGAYPTTYWGQNEQIVTEHTFVIPENAPDGPTQLTLGFYRLEDGSRLNRLDSTANETFVTLTGPVIAP